MTDLAGREHFRIALSIEMEPFAHATLRLRSFYRKLRKTSDGLSQYYRYVHGRCTLSELEAGFPEGAAAAEAEAWRAELGAVAPAAVDDRIRKALSGDGRAPGHWVLIGGPPCQAYSLVGRARRSRDPTFQEDPRHFLYREYLRILAKHRPAVFVFENVRGMLSASAKGVRIFEEVFRDLQSPVAALRSTIGHRGAAAASPEYRIYSVARQANAKLPFDLQDAADFIVKSEEFGIPQRRHRLILVGVRQDLAGEPDALQVERRRVSLECAIGDLPALRSGMSGGVDSPGLWKEWLSNARGTPWMEDAKVERIVREEILRVIKSLRADLEKGYSLARLRYKPRSKWLSDDGQGSVTGHISRSHLPEDLHRYLFAACFAKTKRYAPTLEDFPAGLLPNHRNARYGQANMVFADRFRVQLAEEPATTVTSHISKDGNYYIHYDPMQCRSLTPREAARIQTFPDSYQFEGGQTAQYRQVGNAVPPLLANKIAWRILDLLGKQKDK